MNRLEYNNFKKILNYIYVKKGIVNKRYIEKLLPIIEKAKNNELTARQHECFELYYKESKTIYEIANLLGISPPTVSIHIKKARRNIYEAIRYFVPNVGLLELLKGY